MRLKTFKTEKKEAVKDEIEIPEWSNFGVERSNLVQFEFFLRFTFSITRKHLNALSSQNLPVSTRISAQLSRCREIASKMKV